MDVFDFRKVGIVVSKSKVRKFFHFFEGVKTTSTPCFYVFFAGFDLSIEFFDDESWYDYRFVKYPSCAKV